MYLTKAMRIFVWCTTCIPSGHSLTQHVERYHSLFREKPGAALLGRSPPNSNQCSASLFPQGTYLGTLCVGKRSPPCPLLALSRRFRASRKCPLSRVSEHQDLASSCLFFHWGRRDLLSFAKAPVRGKQATRDLTLKIISDPAAPRSDVVCNVSFSLPPT